MKRKVVAVLMALAICIMNFLGSDYSSISEVEAASKFGRVKFTVEQAEQIIKDADKYCRPNGELGRGAAFNMYNIQDDSELEKYISLSGVSSQYILVKNMYLVTLIMILMLEICATP